MADELTADSIAEAATQPASASVDGQSAAAVGIQDQIAAHRYAETQKGLAKGSGWGMVRVARVKPAGTQE
jgi:hypothetical protein